MCVVPPMASPGATRVALRDFDQAIALNPNFYQAYANRALVYRYMGDSTKAVQDYKRAIQLNSQYDAAYIGRGNVYRQAGRSLIRRSATSIRLLPCRPPTVAPTIIAA